MREKLSVVKIVNQHSTQSPRWWMAKKLWDVVFIDSRLWDISYWFNRPGRPGIPKYCWWFSKHIHTANEFTDHPWLRDYVMSTIHIYSPDIRWSFTCYLTILNSCWSILGWQGLGPAQVPMTTETFRVFAQQARSTVKPGLRNAKDVQISGVCPDMVFFCVWISRLRNK